MTTEEKLDLILENQKTVLAILRNQFPLGEEETADSPISFTQAAVIAKDPTLTMNFDLQKRLFIFTRYIMGIKSGSFERPWDGK